jgi:K+-transporting ATPase KdpF subunit
MQMQEIAYAGLDIHRSDDRVLRTVDWIRAVLRSREVRRKPMHLESAIMLAVSALMAVYLVYALLRPEKF